MEWYSIIEIKRKEKKQNGKYINLYFVLDRNYIDKDNNTRSSEEWISVSDKIFSKFKVGDKVMITRQDFWTRKNGEKKHYDFISDCEISE